MISSPSKKVSLKRINKKKPGFIDSGMVKPVSAKSNIKLYSDFYCIEGQLKGERESERERERERERESKVDYELKGKDTVLDFLLRL